MQTSKGIGAILARIMCLIGVVLILSVVVVAQTEAVASQSVPARAAAPIARLHHAAPPKVYAPPELYAPVKHIAPAVRHIPVAKAQMYVHHMVRAGETLSGIASQYHVPSWQSLAAVNPDQVKAPLYWVYTGRTIRIPTGHIAVRVYSAPKAPKAQTNYAPRRVYRARVVTGRSASHGSPQAIARKMLASYGWSGQWGCLNSLISKESGWNTHAQNPSSPAYGIPQALPGSKMASEGQDWRDSARTQLSWMMKYVSQRYGSPCGAWGHSVAHNWY